MPAEDLCPGELAQPHVRQQHGDHHEAELDDEEPERHADHETRLARGAVDQGHDDDAVDDVEQVMQDGEEGEAAQHGEGAEDRKSTRLNSSHGYISYAVFCLK